MLYLMLNKLFFRFVNIQDFWGSILELFGSVMQCFLSLHLGLCLKIKEFAKIYFVTVQIWNIGFLLDIRLERVNDYYKRAMRLFEWKW